KDNIEQEELTVYDKCFADAESRYDVWKRLIPFYEEIITNEEENIIIVSHGDTLSLFNALWLGLDIELLNKIDLYGISGGVSFLYQDNRGKRIIKRLSDTSFMYHTANPYKILSPPLQDFFVLYFSRHVTNDTAKLTLVCNQCLTVTGVNI